MMQIFSGLFMEPQEGNTKDNLCQKMLSFLVEMEVCSQGQAKNIWQKWQAVHASQIQPLEFLQSQHIPKSICLTAVPPTPKAGSEPDYTRQNTLLAEQIQKEQLLPPPLLQSCLQTCEQKKTSLAQIVIQNRYMKMADLTRILQLTRQKMEMEKFLPKLSPGIVMGDYEILDELGRGGMGIVYRARQKSNGQAVALKIILPSANKNLVKIRRFFREIKATASLHHPHIVPVYGTGKEHGCYYFVMKYIEGDTLDGYIGSHNLTWADQIIMLVKICQALHHAHQNRILHRDLKPSNILVSQEGEPYLTDFGLAKFFEASFSLTKTGDIVGTPCYIAPEQIADSKKVGPPSDIYSLGVILYQMLTGTLPFTAHDFIELYHKIHTQAPVPPIRINPTIPADLNTICLKALAKKPQQRYASASEMAQDLQYAYEGKKVTSTYMESNGLAKYVVYGLCLLSLFLLLCVIFLLAMLYFRKTSPVNFPETSQETAMVPVIREDTLQFARMHLPTKGLPIGENK